MHPWAAVAQSVGTWLGNWRVAGSSPVYLSVSPLCVFLYFGLKKNGYNEVSILFCLFCSFYPDTCPKCLNDVKVRRENAPTAMSTDHHVEIRSDMSWIRTVYPLNFGIHSSVKMLTKAVSVEKEKSMLLPHPIMLWWKMGLCVLFSTVRLKVNRSWRDMIKTRPHSSDEHPCFVQVPIIFLQEPAYAFIQSSDCVTRPSKQALISL